MGRVSGKVLLNCLMLQIDAKSQIAIVTGAGGAIGQDIALRFLEEGAKVSARNVLGPLSVQVCLVDANEEAGREVASKLKASGYDCMFARCNIADENDVKRMVDSAVAQFGSVDILVNWYVKKFNVFKGCITLGFYSLWPADMIQCGDVSVWRGDGCER